MTMSWTTMLVAHKAIVGTLFLFSVAKTFGMSLVLAAVNSTSAQISDQAK